MKKSKKFIALFACGIITILSIASINKESNDGPVYIPPSTQRVGDSALGFNYLVNGDYIKSGIGYKYYLLLNGKDKNNFLARTGKAANISYAFNLIKNEEGLELVVPNCLQCHAQVFEGKLYIGLGNTFQDFSNLGQANDAKTKAVRAAMQMFAPRYYNAATPLIRAFGQIYPYMQTEVQGVNAADRLASLLAAHRNAETLDWSDSALLDIPNEVIPTDVPAWWLLKKKNAMFYNGFGRGDFGKFLLLSNLLTEKDTAEAKATTAHSGDLLTYIKSIQPPKYPFKINTEMAARGKEIFIVTCSKCHGNYGGEESYPNLLIPESLIGTDSALFKTNYQNAQFINWFNKSWYATGNNPAKLVPSNGYVAPPLDGIWITAPYLHNGSVPTLEALLNSKERPKFWRRNFKNPQYDYENVGWKYETVDNVTDKQTYNTTLEGYKNTGHTFGDGLSESDRKNLIEYLKTL